VDGASAGKVSTVIGAAISSGMSPACSGLGRKPQ
jgi:hypothetical protein